MPPRFKFRDGRGKYLLRKALDGMLPDDILNRPALWLTVTLVAGLLVFGVVFAVNSSLHSYLILAFSKADRVTMDVGFYYMSNAAGRLVGTLLSGLSYQIGGLSLCLATAAAMCALSWLCAGRLHRVAA